GRQHMCAQAHAESFGKDELCRLVYPLLLQSIDLLQKLRTGLRRDRIVATRANRLRLRLDGLQPVERQEPAPKVLELFDPSHRQAPLARQPGFFSERIQRLFREPPKFKSVPLPLLRPAPRAVTHGSDTIGQMFEVAR